MFSQAVLSRTNRLQEHKGEMREVPLRSWGPCRGGWLWEGGTRPCVAMAPLTIVTKMAGHTGLGRRDQLESWPEVVSMASG